MLGSHDHTVICVRVSVLAPHAAALAAMTPAQQMAVSRFRQAPKANGPRSG